MIFSSTVFLFLFLPCLLLLYYLIPHRFMALRNYLLLAFSLAFYAYGEPKFILVMLASILVNYFAGRMIAAQTEKRRRQLWLTLGIFFNVAVIFIFKYLNFTVRNLNGLLGLFGGSQIPQTSIALPIGISFFTFQAVSYLVDVYRAQIASQNNLLYLGLYISFFPQLIAGPIVRYIDICDEIENRRETLEQFESGVRRFIYGMAKKVILANNLALAADAAFQADVTGELSLAMAWLGAIAFCLQIFYDFSGYSDMAIGLGRMFGFHFRENFNYPYIARSTREFWQRWHISLGSWFRDYVYFPLGGSRVRTKGRLIFNLFVVWLLTGVWHGANWNYIVWGLMYFASISFERLTGLPDRGGKKTAAAYHLFTLLYIVLGMVVFRSQDMAQAGRYLLTMFGLGNGGLWDMLFVQYLLENLVLLAAAMVLACPVIDWAKRKLRYRECTAASLLRAGVCMVLLVISAAYLILNGYNPFLYFNF